MSTGQTFPQEPDRRKQTETKNETSLFGSSNSSVRTRHTLGCALFKTMWWRLGKHPHRNQTDESKQNQTTKLRSLAHRPPPFARDTPSVARYLRQCCGDATAKEISRQKTSKAKQIGRAHV